MSGDNFKRLSRAASGVAIALGVSALFGWIFDVAVLKSVLPGLVTMKVNTAVSFVLAGASLWLQIERGSAAWRVWTARVCALLAISVGLLTLTEYLLGVDLGIDQLLMRMPADELHTSSPGRMAPNTALSFVLVGSALVLLDANNRALQSLTQTLSVAALFASLVSSVGYAFSTVAFYRIAGSTAMSIHAAFGLAALSIGILASRPRGRLLRFLDWPLRAKLVALLMIVSVAPLTFAAVVDIQAAAKKLEEMTNALLSARADQLVGEIDGFNRTHRLSVEQLARVVATVGCCHDVDEARIQAVRALLATRPASDSAVTSAAILDLSGRVRLATDARIDGLDLSSRGHVREALRGVRVISDVHVAGAEAAGQPAIAYLAPVLGADGALDGIAVIWIRAKAVWDIMKKSNERAGPGSFAVMFDDQGIRIAHSYSDDIVFHPGGALTRGVMRAAVVERRFGDRTKTLLEDVRSFPEQFARALADSPDAQMFHGIAPVNQQWTYGVARRLETVRWTLFCMVPEESLRAQVARGTRDRSVFAGMVIVFSLITGSFFATIFVGRIRTLSNATLRLASGDPYARAVALRADEIGDLGESFNRMADRIESQSAALRKSNSELEERVLQRTAELTQSEQSLSITLDSIGDAVIATDEAGGVVRMNRVAEQLTGWNLCAAKSKPLEEIFRIIDEDTRAAVRSPVERVLGEGVSVGLTKHAILVARDGTECPIADSAAPIVDSDGPIRGVVLVFRDMRTDRAAEEALRASEAKYRELYENLPDMCTTVDIQSETVAECNETFASELGYSKDEIIGRPVRDLYPSDFVLDGDREEFQRSGELRDHERVLQRKDGSRLDVSMSAIAIQDGQGRLFAKAVWRDISARKRAERDRRFVAELSEIPRLSPNALDLMVQVAERLGVHLNVARASFIEVDVNHDRLTVQADYHLGLPSIAGSFALSGFGTENAAEQQAGKTTVVSDTSIDPRTAAKFEATYKPLGTRSSVAVPLLRDGAWIASLVVTDTEPRVWDEREVGLVQSLAERAWLWVEHLRLAAVVREKEAQEVVRQNEKHFRILVEGVKDYAILLLDSKGYIKTWNSGAERIKGYGESEIIGKHFSVFYTDEDVARGHPEHVLKRAAAEGRCAEEGWRVRKGGARFWADVLLTALHDRDGTLEGFAKVTRDDSDRRRADEVLRDRQAQLTASLKEREVLLQEVHHRVKNNLQVISSLINLQKRQMVDVEARRGLDECRARVETIAMIHEKLYQSKDYASIPFSEYARSLADNIFHATGISPANIALKVEIDSVALAVGQAIPCGLILNELISNALKHAFPAERHGAISVELRKLDTELVLIVGDDGVGMPADFDLERSKSLGLHLVATLAQQLHAQLEIVHDGGTSFRVTFPWRQAS